MSRRWLLLSMSLLHRQVAHRTFEMIAAVWSAS